MEKSKYIHKHIQIHGPGQRKSKEGDTLHTPSSKKKRRKKYNARKYVLALLCVWMVLRLHGDTSSCYCVCVCTYFMRGCVYVCMFSLALHLFIRRSIALSIYSFIQLGLDSPTITTTCIRVVPSRRHQPAFLSS